MATRRELTEAIASRHHAAMRAEKKTILDEFINVTSFHRKHAIRALKRTTRQSTVSPAPPTRSRLYEEATRGALTILWEAADRICGKRLKEVTPALLDAMERHGHLHLDDEVRRRLLTMSAATMDRLLKPVREAAKQSRRRSEINNTALRKSTAVRTFNDWNDPPPVSFSKIVSATQFATKCGVTRMGGCNGLVGGSSDESERGGTA